MITFQENQYSVPSEYAGKRVQLQVFNHELHVYYNKKLIACHSISNAKLNYKEEHYIEALQLSSPYYPVVSASVYVRLPSDSTSQWTPLSFANSSYYQACNGLLPSSCYPCRAHYKHQNRDLL